MTLSSRSPAGARTILSPRDVAADHSPFGVSRAIKDRPTVVYYSRHRVFTWHGDRHRYHNSLSYRRSTSKSTRATSLPPGGDSSPDITGSRCKTRTHIRRDSQSAGPWTLSRLNVTNFLCFAGLTFELGRLAVAIISFCISLRCIAQPNPLDECKGQCFYFYNLSMEILDQSFKQKKVH